MTIQKGTICVARCVWVDGRKVEMILPLDNQRSYQEWAGCFSLVGVEE